MFKENKYSRWYFDIINKSRTQEKIGYTEWHHIIPSCLGGIDESSNLVELSAREHFICHLLLLKMNDYNGLKFAFVKMLYSNKYQERRFNSRWYEYAKKLNSEASKARTNLGGYHRGKKAYYNPTTNEMKYFEERLAPAGWILGWPPDRRAKISKEMANRRGYVKDGIRISLREDEIPPEGFVKGGLPHKLENLRRGEVWWHSPVSGEEIKARVCPEGFLNGSARIWITDGLISKQINKVKDSIPEGWKEGKTNPGRKQVLCPISTPLGDFDSPWRFCEKYSLDISFFQNLDSYPNYRTLTKLGLPLEPKQTKKQLGFCYKSS